MDSGFETYVTFALLFGLRSLAYGEVFTATSDVETLSMTLRTLIDDLDKYINQGNQKINVIKKFLKQYKEEYNNAREDFPNYLGNPINAFSVINKLTNDLDFIQNVTQKGFRHSSVIYPTQEDVQGAARAILRLQVTYLLNTTELANGILKGNFSHGHPTVTEHFKPMTTSDCYVLGQQIYTEKEIEIALDWFLEAFHKYDNDDQDTYSFTKVDIVERIIKGYHTLDDFRNALIWNKKLSDVDSNVNQGNDRNILVLQYQKHLEEELQKQRSKKTDSQADTASSEEESNHVKIAKVYEALCRGETDPPSDGFMRLKCHYLTENDPFLKLAPIKTEQLHTGPDVFLFHDVISDDEIQIVKYLAKPKFERAKVINLVTKMVEIVQYRVSKYAFLRDEESGVLARITRRISHFSGLNMDTAEYLQVANYGIGGHYAPHHDYVTKHNTEYKQPTGNRIATVLFYMSDVAQGGATVFLNLGLSVFPVKRAALFWLNLHPSGEGDEATLHAACPVLRGSKWVSNKWIHNVGQEFLRPCNLEYQDEDYVRQNLNRSHWRY